MRKGSSYWWEEKRREEENRIDKRKKFSLRRRKRERKEERERKKEIRKLFFPFRTLVLFWSHRITLLEGIQWGKKMNGSGSREETFLSLFLSLQARIDFSKERKRKRKNRKKKRYTRSERKETQIHYLHISVSLSPVSHLILFLSSLSFTYYSFFFLSFFSSLKKKRKERGTRVVLFFRPQWLLFKSCSCEVLEPWKNFPFNSSSFLLFFLFFLFLLLI